MGTAALACTGITAGLLLGSFLNVCISRLPVGRSIVSPASHCEACGTPLGWFDNVPVLSYLLLRGRCRACGVPIGLRHLTVELACAVWFALGVLPLQHGLTPRTDESVRLLIHQTAFCALGWLLIGLLVIDWTWLRLPDALVVPGALLGFLLLCTDALFLGENQYNLVLQRQVNLNAAGAGRSTGNVFLTGPEHLVYGRIVSVAACFLLLYGVRAVYRTLRGRDGMGLGDAKLLAMIAAFLGFAPAILSLFLGTLLATLYSVGLLVRGRATASTRLPFGSFLAAGGLLAALTGEPVVNWYLGLFR